MTYNEKSSSGWRFFYRVALPISLAAVGVFAVIGGFFLWTSARNDEEAVSRQIRLVSHILNDEQHRITKEQEDVASWKSAVKAVTGELDYEFISTNLGVGMYEFFGHDRSYLLDPSLEPVYAMRDGVSVGPSNYAAEEPALAPLVSQLRQINWQGAFDAYVNGASDQVPNVNEIVQIEGQPAIVSIMPIISEKTDLPQRAGWEFIHITAEFLDAELAAELTSLLLLDGARFDVDATVQKGEASLAFRDTAGNAQAYFFWQPNYPGAELVAETAPIFAGSIAFATLIIAILTLRLHNTTKELEAGRAEAQYVAYHDALTGLGNRALFDLSIEDAIKKTNPHTNPHVALLVLDLDRFKQVNDTLGHGAGDELIKQVADRLRPLVRGTDTIARIGGDEFAIIASEVQTRDDIAALCSRILASIRKPFDLEAGQAFVGVSIGVAMTSSQSTQGTELTREADIALYAAKDGGRNRFRIFEETMSDVVQERQKLEDDLRAALRTDDQLTVKFDPLVRENGNEIIGVEANIVWQHPKHGRVPIEEFMPIAESCGLIEIIGEFVLEEACRSGAKSPGQLMAVRVYPAQLHNPNFFDRVFSILTKTGMQPSDLELEIGEKMLAVGEEIANDTLKKFRQAGVRIALNDFGTGFTSLRLLQQFQVDRIKIDSSFIAELAQSPDPEAITHAVVWLARAIGVEVSADGINSVEQKEFLARMGCMSFQGELYSPEGQAEWLRYTTNSGKPTEADMLERERLKDIEVWDETA